MLTQERLLQAAEEEFMNDEQLAFMRQKLLDMRQQIIGDERVDSPVQADRLSDAADQAQQEEQWMIEIRKRSIESDLLSDIEQALYKVEIGEYGYCEYSGDPIDIRRLLAYPMSRMTVEEQERHERLQQFI